MRFYQKGFIGGFVFGLLFAVAHLYFNIRYDLPLYLIIRGIEGVVSCTGRGCLPYLLLAALLSAIVWGILVVIAAKLLKGLSREAEESGPNEPIV
ncbi:MAG: hypothetical protein HYT40_00350 [Candidatus Sungbacteria bacterium]|uniref:Uncharacterized protein n=1 Tax=Candidatus Sungiibacteriota bacterium TaxID=2750080 RepID=A0A931SDB1_9BACT|nr:hypothetical protein [Candidatus Sungbacteria bacterium]